MTRTWQKTRAGLTELQVLRLFKCALKDDDTLVDVMVEKLYRTMKDFDPSRAKDTVALIVDRDTRAEWKFRALLDDLWIANWIFHHVAPFAQGLSKYSKARRRPVSDHERRHVPLRDVLRSRDR